MRHLLACLALVCVAGLAAASDPASGGKPAGRARVTLPEEDPNFIELLDKLADRAALYRSRALGFTCREVCIVAEYDPDTTEYKKNSRTVRDYLFEEKDGQLREVREDVIQDKGSLKRKSTDFDPPMPPAYAWAALFAKENRGRFHFRPAGQTVKAFRLLTLIDFVGTSPNPGGDTISGWSGQAAIDDRMLNIWSLEARPTGEDVRLQAEILRYTRAFAIVGVPLAAKPHGWKLTVTFGMEQQGLSYPTENILSQSSLGRANRMNESERTTLRYEDYRFFGVEASPEEMSGSEDGDADPNKPRTP